MMICELFVAIDADEAVVTRASPLIRSEHSLSLKLARGFISLGRVGALRRSDAAARHPYPNLPFLLTKLCLIPPFSP
jgi:5-methylthioribose kinase